MFTRLINTSRGVKHIRKYCVAAGKNVVESVAHDSKAGTVVVGFQDGHRSSFLPVWLVDHDPTTIHETSLQRQLDSASLDVDMPLPCSSSVVNGGDQVSFEWGEKQVIFESAFLREHCYDEKSRQDRKSELGGEKRLWNSSDLSKDDVTKVRSGDLFQDQGKSVILEALLRDGIAMVTDMPSTLDETEKITRCIGPPRETFYGAMWDTAPKNAEDVNDTAYTKDGLHAHTDTSYLFDSPGLQLFSCVAQSESKTGLNQFGEIEGATKFVDGFKVLQDLKQQHPETYAFFEKTPLKWHCIENGVHVKAWGKVINVDPDGEVVQFRYNSYDLSPVDYLSDVAEYYRHTKILNEYLRSDEYISYMRMNVGEMVIIDNHRVCHGRTAFSGFRNMVGCYIGNDDWKSNLRDVRFRASGHRATFLND